MTTYIPRITLLLFLLVLVSCSHRSVLEEAETVAGYQVLNRPASNFAASSANRHNKTISYFMEVAMGSEYGLGNFSVRRWEEDIRLEVLGNPTREDLETLHRVMREINELIAPRVTMRIVDSGGNVELYFLPHSEFHRFEPRGIVFYGGFFWTWWKPTGEIHRGRVVIGSDRLTQQHRSHLIREEMTQILGLMNDSDQYPESIFYQQHSEVLKYSALDRQVIRLLYSQPLECGMLDYQVEQYLRKGKLEQRYRYR